MEVPHGPRVFPSALRAVHHRTKRPDVPPAERLLLVERTIVALRHHPDPQGDGQRPAELPARVHLPDGLLRSTAHLRHLPPQGRQALHRRGAPPRHRIVAGTRHAQSQRALLPLQLQRPRHHRPRRLESEWWRHFDRRSARTRLVGLLCARFDSLPGTRGGDLLGQKG